MAASCRDRKCAIVIYYSAFFAIETEQNTKIQKGTEKDGGIRLKNLQCDKLCRQLGHGKNGKHFVIGVYEAYNIY